MRISILVLLISIISFPFARAEQAPEDKEFQEILNEELGGQPSAVTNKAPRPEAAGNIENNHELDLDQETNNQESKIDKKKAAKISEEFPEEAPPVPPKRQPRVEYIHHPQARKGLMRITEDGTYVYRVKRHVGHQAGSIAVGYMAPPNIVNPDTGYRYQDIYGPSTGLLGTYEYQVLHALGKWGIKGGSGLIFASGHGKFSDPATAQQFGNARERFTLYTIPNNVGLIYRAQFWDKQPLVPYGEAGADYFLVAEDRNDKKPTRYGAAPATHFAGGVAFNLSWLDKHNLSRLNEDYGISSIYFFGEFRQIIGLSQTLNFTTQIISGGMLAEF